MRSLLIVCLGLLLVGCGSDAGPVEELSPQNQAKLDEAIRVYEAAMAADRYLSGRKKLRPDWGHP